MRALGFFLAALLATFFVQVFGIALWGKGRGDSLIPGIGMTIVLGVPVSFLGAVLVAFGLSSAIRLLVFGTLGILGTSWAFWTSRYGFEGPAFPVALLAVTHCLLHAVYKGGGAERPPPSPEELSAHLSKIERKHMEHLAKTEARRRNEPDGR